MNDNRIVAFLRVLALIRRLFRRAHISAENSGRFAKVECTVSHAEKDLIKGAERFNAVEVSYSLDSELFEATEDGRYSLGVSIAICFVLDHWECEGDVGWSCREIGWDEYQSKQKSFDSALILQKDLPDFVEDVLASYDKLIQHNFRGLE